MGIFFKKTLIGALMANPHKLKVGQKLFIRDFDRYSSKIEESIIEVIIS